MKSNIIRMKVLFVLVVCFTFARSTGLIFWLSIKLPAFRKLVMIENFTQIMLRNAVKWSWLDKNRGGSGYVDATAI